jgi:hypothetical protein
MRERYRRLHLGVGEGGGWSSVWRQWASGLGDAPDPLQDSRREKVGEMRRVEIGRLGAEERVGAHRQRQIWLRELAGPVDLRRWIASARDDFCERVEKGVEGGDRGDYIVGLDLGNRLGFRALDAIERRRGVGLGRVSCPGKKRRLLGGPESLASDKGIANRAC